MRTQLGALLICLSACSQGGLPDEISGPDGAPEDARSAADLGAAPAPDLVALADLLPPAKDEVLASGPFSKGGTASLVRRASGALELRFSAGFFVDMQMPFCPSSPPDDAAIVLLSNREEIPMWDARFDLKVSNLKAARGEQAYVLGEGDPVGRPYVHVFCYPNPLTPLKQFTLSRAVVRLP